MAGTNSVVPLVRSKECDHNRARSPEAQASKHTSPLYQSQHTSTAWRHPHAPISWVFVPLTDSAFLTRICATDGWTERRRAQTDERLQDNVERATGRASAERQDSHSRRRPLPRRCLPSPATKHAKILRLVFYYAGRVSITTFGR